MKLDDNHLEGLHEQLMSMPKPNMKTHKNEEIYNHLVHMEERVSINTKRNPLRYQLSKITIPIVSLAVLMIISIISLSYIQGEYQSSPSDIESNSQLGHNDAQSYSELGEKSVQQNPIQVSTFGMTYTINSVKRTKEKGSLPVIEIVEKVQNKELLPFDYNSISFDNKGNITNDFSYIIINLTIQNDMDSPQEYLYLNSMSLYGKNNSGNDYVDFFEPKIFDKRLDIEAKDYFHYPLQPKESETFNIGFIISDEKLDIYKDKMDLIINNPGTNKLDDKDVRIIPLSY